MIFSLIRLIARVLSWSPTQATTTECWSVLPGAIFIGNREILYSSSCFWKWFVFVFVCVNQSIFLLQFHYACWIKNIQLGCQCWGKNTLYYILNVLFDIIGLENFSLSFRKSQSSIMKCNLHWCYTFSTGVILFALVLHLRWLDQIFE